MMRSDLRRCSRSRACEVSRWRRRPTRLPDWKLVAARQPRGRRARARHRLRMSSSFTEHIKLDVDIPRGLTRPPQSERLRMARTPQHRVRGCRRGRPCRRSHASAPGCQIAPIANGPSDLVRRPGHQHVDDTLVCLVPAVPEGSVPAQDDALAFGLLTSRTARGTDSPACDSLSQVSENPHASLRVRPSLAGKRRPRSTSLSRAKRTLLSHRSSPWEPGTRGRRVSIPGMHLQGLVRLGAVNECARPTAQRCTSAAPQRCDHHAGNAICSPFNQCLERHRRPVDSTPDRREHLARCSDRSRGHSRIVTDEFTTRRSTGSPPWA